MSGFSADWLALREPYDAAARNRSVLDAVAAAVSRLPSVSIVDLACGTGSTLRAVAPHLPVRQNWRLCDNDLGLLARAAQTQRPPEVLVTATPVDLARDLEMALDGAVDLITTSALLDLVSAEWLERFAIEAAARRLPVYAALSYDGRIQCSPADPLDSVIASAVNRHQRGDKGFGPALGPTAATAAIAQFERVGYAVRSGPADWVFAPGDRAIQDQIVAGWAGAARELGSPAPSDIAAWLTRRRDLTRAGRSSIRVGHVDFFAHPVHER